MPDENRSVKEQVRCLTQAALDCIDRYPRVGWYIGILMTLNAILQLVDLFNIFGGC